MNACSTLREGTPDRLRIILHALATRVIFDETHRAIGVEYLQGERLYRAHPAPNTHDGDMRVDLRRTGGCAGRRCVQLAAAPDALWNRSERTSCRVIESRRASSWRASVGTCRIATRWVSSTACGSMPGRCTAARASARTTRLFRQWRARRGVYTTNGAVLSLFRRSSSDLPLPDLFCMALLAHFRGYRPGYSATVARDLNYLTWVVLKAHTCNRAGTVTLRSSDPRDTPQIDFNYFSEGGDARRARRGRRHSLRAAGDGNIEKKGLAEEEELPGKDVTSDDELAQFVRSHAWGHHACGTCAIGPRDARGVLGSDFTVHGTRGLRVVDASVFPRIPGFFIVSSIYMIAREGG